MGTNNAVGSANVGTVKHIVASILDPTDPNYPEVLISFVFNTQADRVPDSVLGN